MKKNATIGDEDTKLFLVTDDIDDAVNWILEKGIRQYGLKPKNKEKPFRWLFEHE